MWNKMSVISVFLGTFLLVNVPVVFGDHDMTGKIVCGVGQIIRGTAISVQSLCGDRIYVPGISNETFFPPDIFPVSFRGHLEMEDGTTLNFTEGEILHASLSGDDITGLLPSDTISIPEGACDNREVKVVLALEIIPTTESTESWLKRRVLCSFEGVDLDLAVSGTNTVPEIHLSDSVTTLMSAMGSGFDFQLTASNTGSSLPMLSAPADDLNLPIPEPSYFAAVYIKPVTGDIAYTPDECRADNGTRLPNVTKDDIVVETVSFKSDSELAAIDLLGKVKANEDQLQLCGDHVLVFMLDPLNTLWDEGDRCNNFQTIRIMSTQTCKPSCDIIVNPWTADGVQARYRGSGADGRVYRTFEMTDDGVRESDMHDFVGNVGYGRLAVLTHYIKKNHVVDSSACVNFPDATKQLNYLEGEDASAEETKVLPNAFTMARTVLSQLKDSILTPDQAKEQLNSTLQNILSQMHETTEAKVNSNISKFALEKALKEVFKMQAAMLNYDDSCEIGWIMEGKWLHNTKKHDIDTSTVTMLAGHLAAAAIANPGWTCMENLLKKLIKYAETIDNASDDALIQASFFFDEDALKEEAQEALGRCGVNNKCLQKFHKNCLMKNTENWEPLANSNDLICEQYILKRSALSLYKSLGLYDLWKEMQHNDEMEGKFCVRDPLKPRFGPVTLWKSQEDSTGRTYVYSGIPNSDNTQISWTKKAICSCQSCESGSSPSNDMMSDMMSNSTLAEPPLRRRRKK